MPAVYCGHTDFQSEFLTRFPVWIDITTEAAEATNTVLAKIEGTNQKNILIREFVQVVADTFSGVQLLLINGYGIESMVLVRSMYENVVNAAYLMANDAEIKNFLNYQWVESEKQFDDLMTASPDDAPKLSPEKVKELRDNANTVRTDFLRDPSKPGKGVRNSWCKKSLKDRTVHPGLKELYPWIYAMGSRITHGNVAALMFRGSEGAKARYAPSRDFVRMSMIFSHFLMTHLLDIANEAANLGLSALADKGEQRHRRLLAVTGAHPDF